MIGSQNLPAKSFSNEDIYNNTPGVLTVVEVVVDVVDPGDCGCFCVVVAVVVVGVPAIRVHTSPKSSSQLATFWRPISVRYGQFADSSEMQSF